MLRGQGGTGAGSAAAQAAGASVMSTPLPLDGSGNQMRMCIAEEGWSAVPAGRERLPDGDNAITDGSGADRTAGVRHLHDDRLRHRRRLRHPRLE